jgi:DNA processing protein
MLGVGLAGPIGTREVVAALDPIVRDAPGDCAARTGAAEGPISQADREALTVLVSVSGLGPLTLGRLLDAFGSPAEVLAAAAGPGGAATLIAASRDPIAAWPAMGRDVANAVVESLTRRDEILGLVHDLGLRLLAFDDPEFPARLRTIEIPPPALFVRGDVAALAAEHAVAVVGTRRPSDAGRRTAARVAAALARAGAVVVSGLAVGIDGAAHAAVIEERDRTVAFIGGGHARLFPAAHGRLADAIVDSGGAVVSEYFPLLEPTRGTFPQRNRLISGAADAVIVVEAGARSGALLTASWALEQGRECFIVPGSIDAPMSAGCLGFLRDWPNAARIVAGIPQLLDDLGLAAGAAYPKPTRAAGPSSTTRAASSAAILASAAPVERAVADALLAGATIADEIVAVTGLPIGAVLGALTRLESAGLASGSHGRYRPAGALALAS